MFRSLAKGFIHCLLATCILRPAWSQESTVDSVYKNNLLPSPSLTYQPSTDVVIGAYLLYQFKPRHAGNDTRPSNAQFWIASSFNEQTFMQLSHEYLTAGENWYLKGKIDSRFNPEYYYGIGNSTAEEDQIIVEYKFLQVEERVLKQVNHKLFVGGQLKYVWTSDMLFKTTEGDTLAKPLIPGVNGGQYGSLGITILKDERNSILTPTAKKYIELSTDVFFGDFMFWKIKFDYRRYWRIRDDEKKVIALQYLMDWGTGDIPFKEYSKLGGKRIMRGYLEGRYRDLLSSQLQAEFRWNFWGRLGMTTFAGLGNVLPNVSPEPSDIKAAAGAGLRFNINRKDPANVRVDYGFSLTDKVQAVYITFGEAF